MSGGMAARKSSESSDYLFRSHHPEMGQPNHLTASKAGVLQKWLILTISPGLEQEHRAEGGERLQSPWKGMRVPSVFIQDIQ